MTRWVCSLIILCTLLLPTVAEASTTKAQPPPPVGT